MENGIMCESDWHVPNFSARNTGWQTQTGSSSPLNRTADKASSERCVSSQDWNPALTPTRLERRGSVSGPISLSLSRVFLQEMERRRLEQLRIQAEIRNINDENQRRKEEKAEQERLADLRVQEYQQKKMVGTVLSVSCRSKGPTWGGSRRSSSLRSGYHSPPPVGYEF